MSLILRRRAVTVFFSFWSFSLLWVKSVTPLPEWSVWSCWRLSGHWCGGAACQPPRSHPSSPPRAQTRVVAAPCRLRPRTGGRGATGGLLWAAAAQPEGTGGTQENPWDTCCPLLGHSGSGTQTQELLFFELIGQYRIILVSWPGVNVVKWAVERTREKQETMLPQIL